MTFFDHLPATDPTYQLFRDADSPLVRKARDKFLALWLEAHPYLDLQLPSKAATNFHSHFWEVCMAGALLRAGVGLVPRNDRRGRDAGPDLQLKAPLGWVEAVTASGGFGPDGIPDPDDSVADIPAYDRIVLRIINSLGNKLTAYTSNLRSGLIGPSEPYVVAVNGGNIPWARPLSPDPPYVLTSVFPIGSLAAVLNQASDLMDLRFQPRPTIAKANGELVHTDLFLRSEYSPISAVLYSAVEALSLADSDIGHDFVVIHNPYATAPIARGSLPAKREYWLDIEEERLHWT